MGFQMSHADKLGAVTPVFLPTSSIWTPNLQKIPIVGSFNAYLIG
jgi:hypothetical protein